MASGDMEDILVPYKCLEQTVALAESRPSTQHEWVEWGHQVHELKDCGPRIEPIEVDQTASNDEQQLQVWEGVLSQISAAGQQTAIANAPPSVSDYLNPDWSEIWKDLLNRGGRQDNEKWPGDFLWTPRADHFGPKGTYNNSSGNVFPQFTDWVSETAVTSGSADGLSPGLKDYTLELLRLSNSRQNQKQTLSQLPQVWDDEHKQLKINPEYLRAIQESTLGWNYTLMSPEERKKQIQSVWELTTNLDNDAIPAIYRFGASSNVAESEVGELAGTVRSEVTPTFGMLSDEAVQSAIAFDGFGDSMEGTGLMSSVLAEVLPADAEAMSDGVYHGLGPARVSFQDLTGDMSDVIEMALRMSDAMKLLPLILFGQSEDGSKSSSGDDGQGSSGNTDDGEPDRVSYDQALDHYQRTSGETAENIAWMRANPDKEIESGPNEGWTFRRLMKDHVEKRGGEPGFAMGGVVPGPVGAPVPALLHGGERVLRSGQPGGGPLNVCLHVHGSVVSERELVRNVREGLIRLNREVTEMGF